VFVRLLIFCLCALALFATEQVGADAGPTADARSLFRAGQELYRRGDYETAIAHWSAAYELDPRPLLQFNLSQAYGRMGKLVEERAAHRAVAADHDLHVSLASMGRGTDEVLPDTKRPPPAG